MKLLNQMVPSPKKNHEFSSEDGVWKVNLTRTFLSLSTTKYLRRSDFKEKLNRPVDALIEIYMPDTTASFSRVGLRYVDIIKRSELDLQSADWSDLLEPFALGFLGSEEVKHDVQGLDTQYKIGLGDKSGIVRIKTGLVRWQENKDEECFVIDSDFFYEGKMDIENALGKLNGFHVHASNLIQWIITDTLHKAMEPEES